jgi:hypothetical protein
MSPMNGLPKSVARQLHCHSKDLTDLRCCSTQGILYIYHHFDYTRTVKEPRDLTCYNEILLRIWVEAKVTHLQVIRKLKLRRRQSKMIDQFWRDSAWFSWAKKNERDRELHQLNIWKLRKLWQSHHHCRHTSWLCMYHILHPFLRLALAPQFLSWI